MKDMSRATFLKLAAAAALLTFVISIVMVNIHWLGMDGSTEKGQIETLLNVIIVLSALVFSVVMVMMCYAIWKYRAKPGDESDGEPIHGNTRVEIIWTAIPTLIVVSIGIFLMVRLLPGDIIDILFGGDQTASEEVKQQARTSQLEHGVADLLAFVSRVMTLLPGDVLLTGTPAGVGPLEAGDRVEVEVEGIGVLANEVVPEPAR